MLHLPQQPVCTGVVMVVGGPQYRVGSHRQFLLLSRFLAQHGVAVFRFDYRGMGDSEGEISSFEAVDDDIKAAIDTFLTHVPGVQRVMLWGLCDAASAALFYAHQDRRVSHLFLLNPWVRTEAGQAKAYLRHYYLQRVMEKEFWQKLLSGKFDFRASLGSMLGFVRASRQREDIAVGAVEVPASSQKCRSLPLPERMLEGMNSFDGAVCIVISGDDLTAAEFMDLVNSSKGWRKVLKKKQVGFKFLDEANHTFSTRQWRDQVAQWSLECVKGD
jgi:exosortase A-associated hydrolase 1